MAWADRPYHDDNYGAGRFGGRLAMTSVVTWLIIVNAAVFVLDAIFTPSLRAGVISPSYWGNLNVAQAIEHGQVWRLLTYTFVHDGIFHVLFNMLALYFFGPMVESALGGKRFVMFYLLSGLAAAVLFIGMVYLLPGAMFSAGVSAKSAELVGASGCVMGVLIAAAMIAPDMKVMLLIPPMPMKLRTMAIVFITIDLLTVLAGGANAGGAVAHIGGAGFAFVLFRYRSVLSVLDRFDGLREKRRRWGEERQAKKQAAIEGEVDRILAKVSESGLHSLTEKEKRTLKRATASKRDG